MKYLWNHQDNHPNSNNTLQKSTAHGFNSQQTVQNRTLPDTIIVYSASQKNEFEVYLNAAAIPYSIKATKEGFIFVFHRAHYERALLEWKHLNRENKFNEQENRHEEESKTHSTSRSTEFTFPWFSTSVIIFLLAYFHFLIHGSNELAQWMETGAAHNQKIFSGQYWRAISALTLHSDLRHLMGNALGILFFAPFWIKEAGAGWGWLMALAGGCLGNLVNAGFHILVSSDPHVSIGASTALFSLAGLLGSSRISWGWKNHHSLSGRLKQGILIPGFALLGLLSLMGVSGQNTDIFAHLFGMVSGVLLGVTLKKVNRYKSHALFQGSSLMVFFLLIKLSWWAVET